MFDYQYDAENLVRELGIEGADDAFKTNVLARIEQLLDERMLSRVTAVLTEEQMREFGDAQSRPAAQTVLRKYIPELNAMYKEEFDSIVDDLKLVLEA